MLQVLFVKFAALTLLSLSDAFTAGRTSLQNGSYEVKNIYREPLFSGSRQLIFC